LRSCSSTFAGLTLSCTCRRKEPTKNGAELLVHHTLDV
jgi:hypothetical protein